MHPRLLSHALGPVLAMASLGGCAAPEPLEERRLQVIGGDPTGDERASVLYVVTEVATFNGSPVVKIGSATLVAPNLLATALHVVSGNRLTAPFTCDATGNEVSGSMGSLLGAPVAPEKVALYLGPFPGDEPAAYGMQIVSTGSPTICENDLAFVVLDRALELPVVPVYHGPPAQRGDVVTAVGYGFGAGEQVAVASRTQRDVTVTDVGQWLRTFTVSEGPCQGDSGGPSLSAAGELTGVFSSVAADCGPNSQAKYTDVSFFSRLVEDAFEAAGAGSPWTVADAGQGGAGGAGEAGGAASAGEAGQSAGGSVSVAGGDSGCSLAAPESGSASWLAALTGALWVLARRVVASKSKAVRRAQVAHETARLV